MAPLAPFHAEKVYQEVAFPDMLDSVHMERYPTQDEDLIDDGLEESMSLLRKVVELGRAARGSRNMKIRQPLGRVVVKGVGTFDDDLIPIIMSELNVKEVVFEEDLSGYFDMTAEPDPKKLGPKMRAHSGKAREILLKEDPKELAVKARSGGIGIEVDGHEYHLIEDDFRFHEILGDRYAIGTEGDIEVILDLELTDDLIREGVAREVVRRIQTMRKDMDLPYDARISLSISGDGPILLGIEAFKDYIVGETLADSLDIKESTEGKEWEIEGGTFRVKVEQI